MVETSFVICRKCGTLAGAGEAFCPVCEAQLLRRTRFSSAALPAGVCPYCHTPTKQGEQVVICEGCNLLHHQECWDENEGCATYGCGVELEGSVVVEEPSNGSGSTAPRREILWGDVVVGLICVAAVLALVVLLAR